MVTTLDQDIQQVLDAAREHDIVFAAEDIEAHKAQIEESLQQLSSATNEQEVSAAYGAIEQRIDAVSAYIHDTSKEQLGAFKGAFAPSEEEIREKVKLGLDDNIAEAAAKIDIQAAQEAAEEQEASRQAQAAAQQSAEGTSLTPKSFGDALIGGLIGFISGNREMMEASIEYFLGESGVLTGLFESIQGLIGGQENANTTIYDVGGVDRLYSSSFAKEGVDIEATSKILEKLAEAVDISQDGKIDKKEAEGFIDRSIAEAQKRGDEEMQEILGQVKDRISPFKNDAITPLDYKETLAGFKEKAIAGDANGDGLLSGEEVVAGLRQNPKFQAALEAMEAEQAEMEASIDVFGEADRQNNAAENPFGYTAGDELYADSNAGERNFEPSLSRLAEEAASALVGSSSEEATQSDVRDSSAAAGQAAPQSVGDVER